MRDARTLLAVAAHSYFTGQLFSAVQYVAVGLSEEDHCLVADHLEGELVYLFCIILANTKTPAVAQGTRQI